MARAGLLLVLGILLAISARPASAERFGNCAAPGYFEWFDDRLHPEPCDVIATAEIRWRGQVKHLRAVHPHSMPMGDAASYEPLVRQLAARVGAAMDRMGGDIKIDDVTIVFTSYASPSSPRTARDPGFSKGSYIAAATDPNAGDCPIAYYKQATIPAGDDFTFTLAHELFHCIQYKSWPSMSEDGWILEASAEYFAYLAVPAHGADNIATFDARTQTTALNRMSYEAVPFYLWLGDAFGPQRVRVFASGTRTIESAIDADMLFAFAKAYYSQTIHMPDGRAMPSSPQPGAERSINSDTRIVPPPLEPFTLANELWTFDRGRFYQLTHETDPSNVRTAWRKFEGGAWAAPMVEVAGCAGPQRFLVIRTSTHNDRAGATSIRVKSGGNEACSCPAGVWQETAESIRHYFEQSAFPSGGGASKHFVGGTRILTLNEDHTGSFSYQSVEVVTSSRDMRLDQVQNGTSQFTWKVVDGMILTVLRGGTNLLTLDNTMTTPGRTIHETRRAGMQTIGHQYVCDNAGLHLKVAAHRPSFLPPGMPTSSFSADMDFTRIGSAPAPRP